MNKVLRLLILNLVKNVLWYAYIEYIWKALMLKLNKNKLFMSVKELIDVQNGRESVVNEDDSRVVPIDGTPFIAVREHFIWKVVIGNMYASTKVFDSFEDAEDYVNDTDWDLVGSFVLATLLRFGVIDEDLLKNDE